MTIKYDDSGEKVMLGVIVFLIVLLLGLALMIYDLRLEIKSIHQEVSATETGVDLHKRENTIITERMSDELSGLKDDWHSTNRKLVLLEESIDPRSHRWSRIKSVRDAIQSIGRTPLTVEQRTSISAAVVDAAEEFDLEASLILAVIKQESDFNRGAISPKHAKGLMQVMNGTADEVMGWLNMRHYEWRNAKYNIRVGSAYLARMKFRFDDNAELAIKAYNAGPTYVENVEAGIWRDYLPETKDYFPKVLKHQQRFIKAGIDW